MNYDFDNNMFKNDLIKFISNLFDKESFTEKPTCPKLYEAEWKLLNHDLNNGYDYNLLSQNDSVLKYQADFNDFVLILSVQELEKKYNLEVKFCDESAVYQLPYVLDDENFQVKLAHLHCKISNQITKKFEQLGKCMNNLNL